MAHALSLDADAQKSYMTKVGIVHTEHALKYIPHVQNIEMTPPDAMHVELKGNADIHLYAFLFQAINVLKWFTLNQLNAALARFNFGQRVPPVRKTALKGRKGNKPRGKGSVVWTAGELYAFTVSSLPFFRSILPAQALDSPEWKAWVAHADYFSSMMQWSFTQDSIYQLDSKIRLAQKLARKVKSYRALWKPKNHFVQHIPRAITKFGPCRLFWCMRYEAKHKEFKKAARLGNYMNVPRHLATFWARRTHLRLRKAKQKCRDPLIPSEATSTAQFDPIIDNLLWSLLLQWHPQHNPPTPTGISRLSSIEYLGSKVLPGRWLLVVCKVRRAKYLVQVTSLFSVLGKPYDGKLHFAGRCFSPSATLRKDTDHIVFASAEDLIEGTEIVFAFAHTVVTLLTSFMHPDAISFAESL